MAAVMTLDAVAVTIIVHMLVAVKTAEYSVVGAVIFAFSR
jgi:hypothetical protein